MIEFNLNENDLDLFSIQLSEQDDLSQSIICTELGCSTLASEDCPIC